MTEMGSALSKNLTFTDLKKERESKNRQSQGRDKILNDDNTLNTEYVLSGLMQLGKGGKGAELRQTARNQKASDYSEAVPDESEQMEEESESKPKKKKRKKKRKSANNAEADQ